MAIALVNRYVVYTPSRGLESETNSSGLISTENDRLATES